MIGGSVHGCLYRRKASNSSVRTYNFAKGVMLLFKRESAHQWSIVVTRLYTRDDGSVVALVESSGENIVITQQFRAAKLEWERCHADLVLREIEE